MRVSPVNNSQTPGSQGAQRRRQHRRKSESDNASSARQLTPRQRETLQHIAEGLSTKEIAFALGVSVKTVETHRAQLKERLGIYNVAGLVRYALRIGLISPE
jgi:DNA-binding NarL/FixJ family response regulator